MHTVRVPLRCVTMCTTTCTNAIPRAILYAAVAREPARTEAGGRMPQRLARLACAVLPLIFVLGCTSSRSVELSTLAPLSEQDRVTAPSVALPSGSAPSRPGAATPPQPSAEDGLPSVLPSSPESTNVSTPPPAPSVTPPSVTPPSVRPRPTSPVARTPTSAPAPRMTAPSRPVRHCTRN